MSALSGCCLSGPCVTLGVQCVCLIKCCTYFISLLHFLGSLNDIDIPSHGKYMIQIYKSVLQKHIAQTLVLPPQCQNYLLYFSTLEHPWHEMLSALLTFFHDDFLQWHLTPQNCHFHALHLAVFSTNTDRFSRRRCLPSVTPPKSSAAQAI